MVGGPAQQKPGVKNVYWSDVGEVEDDVVEEVHLEDMVEELHNIASIDVQDVQDERGRRLRNFQ